MEKPLYFSAEMDGCPVCCLRRVFFLFFVFFFLSLNFPRLSSRYERREEPSVKHGRDWKTRARWMKSSSQADHFDSGFGHKGAVASRCSLF